MCQTQITFKKIFIMLESKFKTVFKLRYSDKIQIAGFGLSLQMENAWILWLLLVLNKSSRLILLQVGKVFSFSFQVLFYLSDWIVWDKF